MDSLGSLLSGGYWLGEEPWDWESLMPSPCPDVASQHLHIASISSIFTPAVVRYATMHIRR
jgi:hypothetical protein